MRKSFVYRLYPTRSQEEALEQMIEAHRFLYNSALEQRRWAYRQAKVSVTYGQQSAELKAIRRDLPELGAVSFAALQATLRRLDRSFQAFFRRLKAGQKAGYPRFKPRQRFTSVTFPGVVTGNGIRNERLQLPAFGLVKIKLHRPIQGCVKQISVTRRADGWYAILACDLGEMNPPPSVNPPVGIDLGLHSFLATSEGGLVPAPQLYRKAQAKLRRAQRHLARCQRRSSRRKKAVQRVARLHQHVANSRQDFHHKTARDLVDRYGIIAAEALNIDGLCRSRLAKSIYDAGWGQFLTLLEHKAASAGVQVVSVNPRNTSQACSNCGVLVPKKLSMRVHRCPDCGFVADRDVNAALNIKRLGLSRQALIPAVARIV